MKAKEFFNVAIYLRLSRDDIAAGGTNIDGSKAESNSISSQRDMIREFIRKQDNMEIYDIYVDDGWSGANFDRPEFKRMMKDIEAGNVTCVIVKDLSRLGRDYIEAGRLIQKTFPAFSVRFIALTDHFDSLTADYNETSLVVPVKNFVNDSYSVKGQTQCILCHPILDGTADIFFCEIKMIRNLGNRDLLFAVQQPDQIQIHLYKLPVCICHIIVDKKVRDGRISLAIFS